MKVRHIRLKNYKNVSEFEGTLDGSTFFLLGPNNAGKTTVASAIFDILTGTLPSRPIKEGSGAEEAEVKITLTDGREIRARLNEKHNHITVDGVPPKVRSLKDLLGDRAGFDINQFMVASAKAKVEMIEKLVPGFDDITSKYRKAFEARRDANAMVRTFASQLQPVDTDYINMAPIDIQPLLDQIKEAERINNLIKEAHRAQEIEDKYKKKLEEAEKAQAEIDKLNQEKRNLIKAANLPITISENDELTMADGTPLEDQSLSTSAKMMLAFELACYSLGPLQYYHFDGSILDNKTLDLLLQRAEQRGVQLAIERVTPEAEDDQIQLVIC